MNKVALVTGATSMDGRTISHQLIRLGYNVILTYRRSHNLNLEDIKQLYVQDLKLNPKASLSFQYLDLADDVSIRLAIRQILENPKFGKIDELYNFSAQSHVGESFNNPTQTMQVNAMGVYYLLSTIKDLTPSTKFYQASTSECYGGEIGDAPYNEASKLNPKSPYGISKVLAYEWVKYFRHNFGIYACSSFCFNHSNIYRGSQFFISKVCLAATRISLGLQDRLEVGFLGFSRDESWSDNITEAIHKQMQLSEPQDFVLGRGRTFTAYEFLDEAFGYYNLNYQDYIKQDPNLYRPAEVIRLVSDPSKAIKVLGFAPEKMTLKEHISRLNRHYYEQMEEATQSKT